MNRTRSLQRLLLSALPALLAIATPALADPTDHALDDQLAAEAAALAPPFVAPAAVATDPTGAGSWGPVIPWTPHIPVTAATLPDGRLLTFASNQRTTFPSGPEFTYAAVWDPATGAFTEINNTRHDMFCGGVAMLPDGRVVVNGGRNTTVLSSIFDYRTNQWSAIQNMNDPRWYNTSVALSDGTVFTVSGSGGSNTAERWDPTSGWRRLTGIGWGAVTSQPGYINIWHPFLAVAPNGNLFHFGPTDIMDWVNPDGAGSLTPSGQNVPGSHYPKEGGWAMYEEGKIVVAGGGADTTPNPNDSTTGTSTNIAYTVDLNGPTPVVATAASMQFPRQFANTVILPSGEVMIVGGNTSGLKFNDTGSVLTPEVWNPRTGLWRTLADMAVPRNYHSVALLLPDGRVWSGGGGLGGNSADHRDAQIFTPPALFNSDGSLATRPVISQGPAQIGIGSQFTVLATPGLAKFAFIKMSSQTHAMNTDLRYLELGFTEPTPGSYEITAHANRNVLTPGYWMLFALDSASVHSVAKIIQVTADNAPTITYPGDQITAQDAAANLQIFASVGGGGVLTFTASGLPEGLSIAASTGLIAGTISAAPAVYPVTVTATSSTGPAVSTAFNWTVLLPNLGSGQILREWWLNIPGATLSALTSNPAYPANPTGRDLLTSFETPTNWADNLGQRVRGYVYAPVSGQYRFWIAGDDESRLLLGSSANPASATQIARVPSWSNSREWTKFPEQTSALITLVAGQSYYIEALMKEGGGGDNLAVAWALPGTSAPEVIPGQFLSPFLIRSPSIETPGNQTSVVNSVVSLALQASDPDGDSLTFSATGLPPGLAISAPSGVISGSPTSAGSYSVTVTATDGVSAPAAVSFSWTIVNGLTLSPLSGTPQVNGADVSLTVSGTGGTNPRYTWSFGDGSPDTGWSSSPDATHTFPGPGRYIITVTATDDTGRVVSASFNQAIHAPLTARKPSVSSSIAYEVRAVGNARVWVVNPDTNTVSVFDAATRSKLAETAVGTAPRALAIAPDGRVWVTNAEAATISILSNSTFAVAQTIALPRGSRPFGIAFDQANAWVALEATGRILRLNSAGVQTADIDAGLNVRHVSVSADGAQVYVSRFITPRLSGEETATIETTNQGGEIIVIGAATLAIERTIILQHSEELDTSISGKGIPNYIGAPAISPDGLSAWIPSKQDNVKRGVLRSGQQLTHESAVRSIASRIDLVAQAEDHAARVDFDNAGMPSAICFDPWGIYAFTAIEASRAVAVIDVWNQREIVRFGVGRAPQGLTISPDGTTLFVHNFMDRTVSVLDVSGIVGGSELPATIAATLNCVATETLSPQVLLGKQLFYDAKDNRLALQEYLSCAACHNDGGQDGRVWDFTGFGEGLRNTITLKGHGAHGVPHWTGNFDEVQDFENQIRNFAGGTGLITNGAPNPPLGAPNAGRSADLDALAAYVGSLITSGASPARAAAATLPAAAIAGRTIFKAQNCASCHSGAPFTNSALNVFRDVGTIRQPTSGQRLGAALPGFDVPTLRGLWATAPYLHDGSAATIGEAIRAHSGVSLSDPDLANLAAYVSNIDDDIASAPSQLTLLLSTASANVGGSFTVNAAFSGPATGFAIADIAVTNGTAANLMGTGANYSFTVTPGVVGTVNVSVAAGLVLDADGDTGLASNALAVNYEQTNRPPIINAIGTQTTVRGQAVNLQAQASDPDGQAMTYSASGLPLGLSINAAGLISGTVSAGAAAANSVTVTVSDGSLSASTSFIWNTIAPPVLALTGRDIGSPGKAGSNSVSAGIYTVKGSGADIWGTSDKFRFVSQTFTGDGEIIVRVTSQTKTNAWAKAGIMFRETLNANSRHAMMVLTPSNGTAFQYRSSTGGSSLHVAGASVAAPNNWLRLTRRGNVFTAYRSSDGANWTQVGSATIPMAAAVNIGLCVTSHVNATLSTAKFDNLQLLP